MTVSAKILVVGQRVACSLPYAGQGIVFAIHGTQVPESVRSTGVSVSGGMARVDVVFLNGSVSHKLSEALVRGSVQWRISDEVATREEIDAALEHSREVAAAEAKASERKAREYAAEVQRLQAEAEFGYLAQGTDLYSGTLASKNIRASLKRSFPGIKFSVRKRHFGTIAIHWTDGPTQSQVDEAIRPYRSGYYCTNEDRHISEPSPWNTVFGGAEYLQTSRDTSPALVERAIDTLFATLSAPLAGIERPTPEQYKAGSTRCTRVPSLGEDLQQLIWRTLVVTQ